MIRFPLKDKPRKLKGVLIGPGSGPEERIQYLKKCVTALIRTERIEGRVDKLNETRTYAEQLINLAIQHGDRHKPTMAMADAWLLEKDLVHKLFKVLVPRFEKYPTAFTSVYNLPAKYPGMGRFQAVLELKGNPYPPIIPQQRETRHLLTNVLITAASKDFYHDRKLATAPPTSNASAADESLNQSLEDVDSTEANVTENVPHEHVLKSNSSPEKSS